MSLSARRAWIEIRKKPLRIKLLTSLSARRAWIEIKSGFQPLIASMVALRKESVDRNNHHLAVDLVESVALRKESVDRNSFNPQQWHLAQQSLSARRAWIEILIFSRQVCLTWSLSARRAWIEIKKIGRLLVAVRVALRKESVDRNREQFKYVVQCRVALRKESVDRNKTLIVLTE